MPPRRRPQFTQENIDQQLQQIHLLDASSSSENLEQLGPIIKQIHANGHQEAYLRTVQGLIESKDAEIEKICGENYQDFIASVSTLFTVKQYTMTMKEKITSLDSNVSQLGHGLVDKKRALLQTKRTAANLDSAVDAMQACLTVLDVVNRVGEMVKEGKYWSALRSLEDIESMPPTSLSQTPFYQHLLSSLPSIRDQIKRAVTASMKQWLLEIRNVSGQIGMLALEGMEARTRRWRSRKEKDPSLRQNKVGSAVELITYEKTEHNVLENDKLQVDFKPLYECIHIYTALDSLHELQKAYQADRKAQSDLILPSPLPLSSLPSLTQEITGFFIIENQVISTTDDFRSEREIEELWDSLIGRLAIEIEASLKVETDPDTFLSVKECLLSFIMTLEPYSHSTNNLQSLILVLFEKYTYLLEKQFSRRFEDIVARDDHQPMHIEKPNELSAVLEVVWIDAREVQELEENNLPQNLPWSQTFYLCCQDIRSYIQKFYQFVEGVSRHHRNIDELLAKSLDNLLIRSISESIAKRLAATSALSQIAQVVMNAEYFQLTCTELGRSLTSLRSASKGGIIDLKAPQSFADTQSKALQRITKIIASKLDDFFELSEYDWTPSTRETAPSMYLYELINWLTTVVDSLVIQDLYKDEAYKGAALYIGECLAEFLFSRNIPEMNENAVSNILVDVDFIEDEFKRMGREHLNSIFVELRLITSIVLNDNVHEYLVPSIRQTTYSTVKPKKLQALLEKLGRYGASTRDPAIRERGEKRRREADAVGRLFPGESR